MAARVLLNVHVAPISVSAVAAHRLRSVNRAFKPHQSRAFYAAALPLIMLARDSFPAFGEAKGASDLLSRFQKIKVTLPSPKVERVAARRADG